jgi:hypothetical protein
MAGKDTCSRTAYTVSEAMHILARDFNPARTLKILTTNPDATSKPDEGG